MQATISIMNARPLIFIKLLANGQIVELELFIHTELGNEIPTEIALLTSLRLGRSLLLDMSEEGGFLFQ